MIGQSSNDIRFELLQVKLDEYSVDNPKINKLVDISLTGTIPEFALAFSRETKINLTVSPKLNQKVVVNFSDTQPKDILLHLCRFYDLDLVVSGSIISLIPFDKPVRATQPKQIEITFNSYNKKVEMNLKRDTLDNVLEILSRAGGINVIATEKAGKKLVSGYIGQSDIPDALIQMSVRNGLIFSDENPDYFLLDVADGKGLKGNESTARRKGSKNNKTKSRQSNLGKLGMSSVTDSLGKQLFTIKAKEANLNELVKALSEEANVNYFVANEPEGLIELDLKDISYEQTLDHIFQGTEFTFKDIDGVYVFGGRTTEGLIDTRVIQLNERSVKDFIQYIPEDLLVSVKVKEFIELNSLIISGSPVGISQLKEFIREVDRRVPVITIELIIVDVNKQSEINLGIEAGIGSEPATAGGSVFPGVDFNFSARGINGLLDLLAGNGIVNLGRVNPNFYASLQAVEENGYAKIHSRPRLSTINGTEANFSLGETRYYSIQRTTLQGNLNPISLQDRSFEAVNADFNVSILPVVSGDGEVTLDIEVSQSDFLGQIQNDAPPAQVSRNFTSSIRVSNQEMIVLGGLESTTIEDSGRGIPLLSRIPILKWFFSKRRKSRQKSRLLIFVRSTVIY